MGHSELKSKTTELTFWPSPQDYNEALQNPDVAFSDTELRRASVVTDSLGLPRPISGSFASVYHLKGELKNYAVRCFLHRVPDQQTRYEMISEFVRQANLDHTVSFECIEQGVQIQGIWFPILKMEWVDGDTLDCFIEKNLHEPDKIANLAEKFQKMCTDLQTTGMAHGDLQHGNILVTTSGDVRIVDYDGMFVPRMSGLLSTERGHRNYQHPARSAGHFNDSLDNFSMLVINLSLRMLARDPSLYARLNADDSLLLKFADLADSRRSRAFEILESHPDAEVCRLGKLLRWQCEQSPDNIIRLCDLPDDPPELEPIDVPSAVAQVPNSAPAYPSLNDETLPKWWKLFHARPDLMEGIEPELLVPDRKVRRTPFVLCDYRGWGSCFAYLICNWIALITMHPCFYDSAYQFVLPVAVILVLAAILALFAGPIMLLGNLAAIADRFAQRDLFRRGSPARARIAMITLVPTIGCRKYNVTVGYQVLDENSSTNRQHSQIIVWGPELHGRKLEEGEELTVLYDRRNPQRAVFYSYGQYAVDEPNA